jgi:hypothetical protein
MRTVALSEIRRSQRWLAGRTRNVVSAAGLCLAWSMLAPAQTPDYVRQILERLDRLEAQNRVLTAEVNALREKLAGAQSNQPANGPSVQERLEVQENRTEELAQVKVEASQRFPLRITGMALFNSYLNSSGSGGAEYPTTAVAGREGSGGATLRQSVIGLDYSGPRTVWGGSVSGSLRLDLFGGSGQRLGETVRLRTGSIGIDWRNRSLLAGVEKPIISPREPDSLAQVGVSPLSGAGNLWLWIPQVRLQQALRFGRQSGLRAQVGIVQTREAYPSVPSAYGAGDAYGVYYEAARPGVEARLELFGGAKRRVEIASGLHHSVSHIAGISVPSDVYSLDWFVRPWHPLEFTGAAFTGRNVTPLGTGGIRQGVVLLSPGRAVPVHSRGGWGQLTYRATPRLWFNFFSGQQDDRNSDLRSGGIGKNLVYGANFFFRLAPNVLGSLEASQTRTSYIGDSTLLNNHYDLALAYLF